MTMSQAIKLFLEHITILGRSLETVDSYRKLLDKLNRFLCKEKNCQVYIDEITGDDIEKYLTQERDKDFSSAHKFNMITAFKLLMSFCYNKGYCKTNIAKQVKQIKRRVKERPYLSEEELEKLFEELDHPIIKPAVFTLYYAGLRINECIKLTFDDVDFDKNLIIVKKDKENQTRSIPINYKLRDELIYYLDNSRIDNNTENFFSTRTGKISEGYVNRILQESAVKAGIDKHISCHILRHSFASNLVLKGVNIHKVQKLLGHTSLKTTSIYLHANINELRKTVGLI